MTAPAAARLPDGRLHFQHGPIDLILEAFGPEPEVTAAYRQAWAAFRPILQELVAVLPTLRTPASELVAAGVIPPAASPTQRIDPVRTTPARLAEASALQQHCTGPSRDEAPATMHAAQQVLATAAPQTGVNASTLSPVGTAMISAAAAHQPAFVTPMAAVAGAVADHVLAAMTRGRRLDRAYVNNGGDAALHLATGRELTAAGGPALSARIRVTADGPVRGIATSGWRGRSHSLGIADAVTVLARTAAEADVAATLIANFVDLPGHPAITRRPARQLAPDSDLGDRPVTVAVGSLTPAETARALAAGRTRAEAMRRCGLIAAAALWLGDASVIVGDARPLP